MDKKLGLLKQAKRKTEWRNRMKSYVSATQRIIEAITAPLGFFVLALLIVETFLASVLVGAGLTDVYKSIGMWLGVGLFVFVNVLV